MCARKRALSLFIFFEGFAINKLSINPLLLSGTIE